jgi:hypothetical protein
MQLSACRVNSVEEIFFVRIAWRAARRVSNASMLREGKDCRQESKQSAGAKDRENRGAYLSEKYVIYPLH